MLLRLMEEKFGDKALSNQLVGAYLIGWRVTPEDLAKYPFLKMAQNAGDTGVIVSFNSEAEGVQTSLIVPDKTIGINPLNWKTDSTPASASQKFGSCLYRLLWRGCKRRAKLDRSLSGSDPGNPAGNGCNRG